MQANTLSGGFADPAIQSAQAFRSVMEAMARPGTLQDIEGAAPPAPVSPAMGAVLLTLCDTETPVYLAGDMDCDAVRAWLSFHTGAPFVGPAHCMFAVGKWDALVPLALYPIGTSEYPDRSATLIVECDALVTSGATLTGPGIKDHAALSLPYVEAFQANRKLFPLGLDFIFTCGECLAALPRSTEVSRSSDEAHAGAS
ncbi:phosphonate C-P lyase system protein PhnH [Roseobacter denitrificans]|uniref:Phosphonate metabolism protein, putative n=1 Tax=Roseobacter denitrificans (strain ATCC 33942 / OCh 114) TaxID=375451 RepID=Q166Y0_ROSDO|nr:phosphonate C-P lyase system protein PhnH [Roseobacter denitrificans]ABG31963.1 phosphonate metabolism protein, putative [Roseobacter denitrificans OCh 114]AVL51499.1 phosphonate C-P lyase system protein PhnH [Roseobacter denitrificans]SFG35333.1 alpha-D-ribose 1-methylphosphonate 5-triphosphate synthase subunit PhnH [Roseobacter denitrificans OCh 114]